MEKKLCFNKSLYATGKFKSKSESYKIFRKRKIIPILTPNLEKIEIELNLKSKKKDVIIDFNDIETSLLVGYRNSNDLNVDKKSEIYVLKKMNSYNRKDMQQNVLNFTKKL
jgi:hypothetical protein